MSNQRIDWGCLEDKRPGLCGELPHRKSRIEPGSARRLPALFQKVAHQLGLLFRDLRDRKSGRSTTIFRRRGRVLRPVLYLRVEVANFRIFTPIFRRLSQSLSSIPNHLSAAMYLPLTKSLPVDGAPRRNAGPASRKSAGGATQPSRRSSVLRKRPGLGPQRAVRHGSPGAQEF